MKFLKAHWIVRFFLIILSGHLMACSDLVSEADDNARETRERNDKLAAAYSKINGNFTGVFTRGTAQGDRDFPVELNLTILRKLEGSAGDGSPIERPILKGTFNYQKLVAPVEFIEFESSYDRNTGLITLSYSVSGDESQFINIRGYFSGSKSNANLQLSATYTRNNGVLGTMKLKYQGPPKSPADKEFDQDRRFKLMYDGILGYYQGQLEDRHGYPYLRLGIEIYLVQNELKAEIIYLDYSGGSLDAVGKAGYNPFTGEVSVEAKAPANVSHRNEYLFRGSGKITGDFLELKQTETLTGPQGTFRAQRQ